MKVRFLKTRTVQDGSGARFEADHVYELSDDSAQHFMRRGVAVAHTADKEEQEKLDNPAKAHESAADTKAALKDREKQLADKQKAADAEREAQEAAVAEQEEEAKRLDVEAATRDAEVKEAAEKNAPRRPDAFSGKDIEKETTESVAAKGRAAKTHKK